MDGKHVLGGFLAGGLLSSCWWSVAVFGPLPFTLLPSIIGSIVFLVVFISWVACDL